MTEADARRSLLIACRDVGVSTDDPELIRLGTNAVFRVDNQVIGRVAPNLTYSAMPKNRFGSPDG